MAPMARVTQPSGLSMHPIRSSTKVRRERGGTATRKKEIHSESSRQAWAVSDMSGYPGSKTPHWSPRCPLGVVFRAGNAATPQIECHVKCFLHFCFNFLKYFSCVWDSFGIGQLQRVSNYNER